MSTILDKDEMRAAYENVRKDGSDTTWAVLKYEGTSIHVSATGTDHTEFLDQFTDDERAFGYIRIVTGDELSKRAKFAFITWSGSNVSPLKRAKLSTDKAFVKQVMQNFAVEILTSEKEDIQLDCITDQIRKVGGANYGTGVRD